MLLQSSFYTPAEPSFPPGGGGEPQKMTETECRLYRFIFPKPQETYKSSAFSGQPHGLDPRVASKVITEGRRGSNTLGPLLPVFGKQTLKVDNLDLANTALKSPHHCQLLTHASDDKNATLDEMGKGRPLR